MENQTVKYSIGEYKEALIKAPYHFLGACKWYFPALSTIRLDEVVERNADNYQGKLCSHLDNLRIQINVLLSRPRDFEPNRKSDLESRI